MWFVHSLNLFRAHLPRMKLHTQKILQERRKIFFSYVLCAFCLVLQPSTGYKIKEAWAAMPRLYVKVVGIPLSEDVDNTAPRLMSVETIKPTLADCD